MKIPLVILICAPFWAMAAVFCIALIRMASTPLFVRTWAEEDRIVIPLSIGAGVVAESVLLALRFLA